MSVDNSTKQKAHSVIEVTDHSFQQEVLESTLPVLVDFWAEWCRPCKMLAPVIEEISIELKDKIKIVKMDIQEHPDISSKMGIRSIPTMMIFKNGRDVATISGFKPKDSITKWIHENTQSY